MAEHEEILGREIADIRLSALRLTAPGIWAAQCPLLEVKQTLQLTAKMSANDRLC